MTSYDFTVAHRHIPETVVDGQRLGRHVKHDSRSLLYPAELATGIVSVKHATNGLPLDQGSIGSCTGNALIGALNTAPNFSGTIRTEADAVALYGRETADEGSPYPPNDPGGSGVAVCTAAKELGLISSYTTAQGLDAALKALVLAPALTGVNWYTSFDHPDATGMVAIAPGATVRGGHEFVAEEIDAANQLVWFTNSWGTAYGVGGRFCMAWSTWGQLLSEQGDVTIPVR